MIGQAEGLAFRAAPLCSILAAEIDWKVVGYLLYFVGVDMNEVAPALHINDLFVHEASHRKGVGGSLIHKAREIATARGAGRLFWTV